jgi:hypothetical protein
MSRRASSPSSTRVSLTLRDFNVFVIDEARLCWVSKDNGTHAADLNQIKDKQAILPRLLGLMLLGPSLISEEVRKFLQDKDDNLFLLPYLNAVDLLSVDQVTILCSQLSIQDRNVFRTGAGLRVVDQIVLAMSVVKLAAGEKSVVCHLSTAEILQLSHKAEWSQHFNAVAANIFPVVPQDGSGVLQPTSGATVPSAGPAVSGSGAPARRPPTEEDRMSLPVVRRVLRSLGSLSAKEDVQLKQWAAQYGSNFNIHRLTWPLLAESERSAIDLLLEMVSNADYDDIGIARDAVVHAATKLRSARLEWDDVNVLMHAPQSAVAQMAAKQTPQSAFVGIMNPPAAAPAFVEVPEDSPFAYQSNEWDDHETRGRILGKRSRVEDAENEKDANADQPNFVDVTNQAHKLVVVKVTGLAGLAPQMVVKHLDDMFWSHNAGDLWDINARQCKDDSGNGLHLIVDSRSADKVLKGSLVRRMQATNGDVLQVQSCPERKVLLQMGSRTHAPPQAAPRSFPERKVVDVSYSQSSSVLPRLCFSSFFPFSVKSAFLSFWGSGESECCGAPIEFHIPADGDAIDAKMLLINKKGLWVAKGTTDENACAEPRPGWSMNWNIPIMPSDGSNAPPQNFFEHQSRICHSFIGRRGGQKKKPHGIAVSAEVSQEFAFGVFANDVGAEWQCDPTIAPMKHDHRPGCVDRVGARNVALVSYASSSPRAQEGYAATGDFRCGSTMFLMHFGKRLIADIGWFRWWFPTSYMNGTWHMPPEEFLAHIYYGYKVRRWQRKDGGITKRRKMESFPSLSECKSIWSREWFPFLGLSKHDECMWKLDGLLSVSDVMDGCVLTYGIPSLLGTRHSCNHTTGVFQGQRIVLSLTPNRTWSLKFLFSNVQSMTTSKWCHISGLVDMLSLNLLALCELWSCTGQTLSLPGFRRCMSKLQAQGQGMGVWCSRDVCSEMHILLDNRHVFLVQCIMHGHEVIICQFHMPERSQVGAYRTVLFEAKQALAPYGQAFIICLGDWNRFVPRHGDSTVFMSDIGLRVVENGTEERLHKDWLGVPRNNCQSAWICYTKGVADHPTCAGCVDIRHYQSAGSYRDVNLKKWDMCDTLAFGDMLEAFSMACTSIAEWLAWHREICASVEASRRIRIECQKSPDAMLFEQHLAANLYGATNIDANWDRWKADAQWYSLVKERQLLQRAEFVTDVSRKLHLKKSSPFVNLSQVLEPESGRIVRGEEILPVVQCEAKKRHPPTPLPLPSHWVHLHLGPTLDSCNDASLFQTEYMRALYLLARSDGVYDGIERHANILHALCAATGQSSYTSTMDGFAPALSAQYGLHSLLWLKALLYMPTIELPDEVHRCPDIPLFKKVGADLNECTRPIIIESGVHRMRQKEWFQRIQMGIRPELFLNCQFSITKGLPPSQLRRLLYFIIWQHFKQRKGLSILLLDQSNAYGQVDRDALLEQATCDPALSWAGKQANALYRKLRAHVVTAHGLSEPYSVDGGIIQGGGLDPLWYVLYSVMLFMGVIGRMQGVKLSLGGTQVNVCMLAVVDDTLLIAPDISQLQRHIPLVLSQIKLLNGKCNPAKFNLLAYECDGQIIKCSRGSISVDGHHVQCASRHDYIKLLGGNINVLHRAKQDGIKLRQKCRFLLPILKRHVPSIPLFSLILEGCVIVGWVYRKLVD